MKLADYIAQFLVEQGIRHVFGITGGAVVHIFDSIAKQKGIMPVFTHHEQAAALAAEAYSKITENIGACIVTTGPGGTNAITGLCAAWLDSVPCVFISGQTRHELTSHGRPVRQVGSQEYDIIRLVKPLTKYAVMIDDPKKIKYYLQKAVHIAKSDRPGPVWVDVPLDYQFADIDPEQLESFIPSEQSQQDASLKAILKNIEKCVKLLSSSRRPLILAGYGIRLAHAENEFIKLIEKFQIPFVSTWNASDILPTGHDLYVGRPGTAGQRGANLAIQNCDLLVAIGSHLSVPITGTRAELFARGAKKIVVDIDDIELKNINLNIDLPIQSDAKYFILELLKHKLKSIKTEWVKACRKYSNYNRIHAEWKRQRRSVNPYVFLDKLSSMLGKSDIIVVDGGGTVVYTSYHALRIKKGQRLVLSSGICAMGTGIPESIGACFANGKKRTICLCGDGSMQLNIHELQTIFHHKLPIKIFVFNNGGYLAIRHTQRDFLDKRYIGSSAGGGMSLPDFKKVAIAYGIKSIMIDNHGDMQRKMKYVLRYDGPVVCELMISEEQDVLPRQGFIPKGDGTFVPRPLEDMYPFLDRKEFIENMFIEPMPESM